jgi:signal transduction histidine kinase
VSDPGDIWRDVPRLVRMLVHARGQVLVALLAFGLIVALSISPYLLRPYDGISYSIYGGEVSLVDSGKPGDISGVQVGDRVLAIGGLPLDPCFLRPIFPPGVRSGDTLVYEVQRGAHMLSLPLVIGGHFDDPTWFGPILVTAVLALWFWAIGLALCLFAPVGDVRSRLTGLYWLLASIVMAGGLGIQSGFWAASTIMVGAWSLLIGAFVAAHLYFPAPILSRRLRNRLVYGLAAFSLLLAGWKVFDDWVIKPCASFYLWTGISVGTLVATLFFLATFAVVGLLIYHRSRNGPEIRRQVNIILWGTLLGFGPFFILTLLPLLFFRQEYVPGSYTVLFTGLVPLVYGYVIYQRKLLRLDFAINRLVVFFALAWIVLLVAIAVLSLLVWVFRLPIQLALFGGLLAAGAALPSAYLRSRVQVYVNRILYGDHYDFYTVTAHFSSRLARTMDRQALVNLLTLNLAQKMGIREVALLLLEGQSLKTQDASITTSVRDELCSRLLAGGTPLRAAQLWDRLSPAATQRWQEYAWVQLFVPIIFEGDLQGLLMLGERSVGDVFSDQDISIIASVAHQAAIAYANVRLVEHQRELAQQLVRLDEEQRKQIARDLHDLVLPEVTYARYRLQEDPSEAEKILDQVTGRLRQMITDQRTVMLDQGLELALQELVKGMQSVAGDKPSILWHSRKTQPFSLSEEQVVTFYRIAQEAIHNALQHAQAEHISLVLEDGDGLLRLIVEDDGIGFRPAEMEPARTGDRHFGLLGMHERAAMIGAGLLIESDVGEGTTVILEVKTPPP